MAENEQDGASQADLKERIGRLEAEVQELRPPKQETAHEYVQRLNKSSADANEDPLGKIPFEDIEQKKVEDRAERAINEAGGTVNDFTENQLWQAHCLTNWPTVHLQRYIEMAARRKAKAQQSGNQGKR